MRILLTGGAGYVGSACLRWLLKNGHEAVAYDNMLEGNRGAVPGDRLVVGDILEREALVGAMRIHRIDAVMHFAALASVPASIAQPEEYWRTNVIGTKNVLDAMREVGINRLCFSSSAATYSFSVPMPITEDSAQLPQTPYGTTKLACEWIIKDYARAYGIRYALLRYFNASGADPDGKFGEDRRNESHLIPLILLAALGKKPPVKLYGTDWPTPDGTCIRDYVHTDDLASAHQLSIEALAEKPALVFNVGTGQGNSIRQVMDACEAAVGKPIPHEWGPRRPGDPGVLVAGSDRLKNELGWKPRYTDIREVVASAWRWHSSHPDGYRTQAAKA